MKCTFFCYIKARSWVNGYRRFDRQYESDFEMDKRRKTFLPVEHIAKIVLRKFPETNRQ